MIPKTLSDFEIMKGQNRAICYSYKCNAADQTYVVSILDKKITCNKEGGVKTVDGLEGSFYCADYLSVCTKTAECKDAIECALNKVSFEFQAINYTVNPDSYAPLNSTIAGVALIPQVPAGSVTKPSIKSDNGGQYLVIRFAYLVLLVLIFGN